MSLFDDISAIECPDCGMTDPLEIIYGIPSEEMLEAALSGLIELGGAVVDATAPAYRCRNGECGLAFGSF